MPKRLFRISLIVMAVLYACLGIAAIRLHRCVYRAPNICLTERELVSTMYEFTLQDRQDAFELANEVVNQLGLEKTQFSVWFEGLEIEVVLDNNQVRYDGGFKSASDPGILGKIFISGPESIAYHEVLHALQTLKVRELLESKGLSRKSAANKAVWIFQWVMSAEADDYRWAIEWMPNWEGCRYEVLHDLTSHQTCLLWKPFVNDQDIFNLGLPSWGSKLMQDWKENVNYYYDSYYALAEGS